MGLALPSRVRRVACAFLAMCRWAKSVTSENRADRAPERSVGSLARANAVARLEPEAPPGFLEGCLHLPAFAGVSRIARGSAPDRRRGRCTTAGPPGSRTLLAGRGSTPAGAKARRASPRAVPHRRVEERLNDELFSAIPTGHHDRVPTDGRIFDHHRKVRQSLPLEARRSAPPPTRLSEWGRLVEDVILQAQAGDEGDRVGEPSAAVQ